MTDSTMDSRKRWKAELFNYDYYLPDDTPECTYCLTRKQAEILRGLLTPLAWTTRWLSEDTEIDKLTVEQYRDDIIRRLMMDCCGGEFGIIFQWTEDGVLQQSEDGGTTWEDVPQEDPRNSSTVYPPVPGDVTDDKKCIAATSVKTLIKEQVGDQLTDDMSRYTLGQLIHDWVTIYIQTSNPFEALITIITNQILALVIATLRPALTDDVYDKMMCCVLDNMADDLSFSDAQWQAVRTCILAKIDGIAGVFLEHLIFLIGKVGLTNLARSQAAMAGDCSSCSSTCADNFHINSDVGTEITRTGDSITVAAVFYAPYGFYTASIRTDDISTCCYVNGLDILTEGVTLLDNHYFDCGSDTEHSGNPDITGHCISLWTVLLSGAGTVKFKLGDCP